MTRLIRERIKSDQSGTDVARHRSAKSYKQIVECVLCASMPGEEKGLPESLCTCGRSLSRFTWSTFAFRHVQLRSAQTDIGTQQGDEGEELCWDPPQLLPPAVPRQD